jgi:CDGSH-type Zn-finger protein
VDEAVVAQPGPFAVELRGQHQRVIRLEAERHATDCDGSHKETELTPVVFKAEHEGRAYPCACKTGQGRPYCSGSYDRL